MHRFVFIAAVTAALCGLGSGPGPARAGDLKNLLALCSDPSTPPREALNACQTAGEEGRLDARRRSLVWMNAGIAAYALGRYDDAILADNKAIDADPRLADAFVNRAQARDRLDRVPGALSDYAAAISIEPKNVGAYLGRGVMMLTRGAPDRALPDFSRALELQPDLTSARYNRGLAQLQLGHYAEARQDFTDVIREKPDEAGAFLNRGRARAALGDPRAGADFDHAVELRKEWPVAWYMRGRYLDQKGEQEAANESFLRAYQLGYSDPWLIERVRKISGG